MTKIMEAKEIAEKHGLDLVTAGAIHLRLMGVTQQMFANETRSAFSVIARDQVDMGVAILLVTEGKSEACAITAGCMQHYTIANHLCNLIIGEWGYENLNPGDVIICNDPYRGAAHQADVDLLRPVFVDGELVFVLHALSHILDVGGMYAGCLWMEATDYYQEGLIIPPTLLYSKDVPVRSTFNLILENTRTPMHNLGDLRALYGTLVVGERLLKGLISRYGLETVRAGARYSLDYAENSMRRALLKIPDGVYGHEETFDDDSITQEPQKMKMSIIKKGDSAEIDWSGTQRQSLGPTKNPVVENSRPLLGIKMVLDPESPMNAGMMRPFDFLAPRGSLVLCLPPASCCEHVETGCRGTGMASVAIGKADPNIAIGMDASAFCAPIFAGTDTRPGKGNAPWAGIFVSGGGWGGTSTCDGSSFCSPPIGGNMRSSVFEHVEQEMPLRMWEWCALTDSAGPGKYRGGMGGAVTIEVLVDNASVTTIGDRGKFPPTGVVGGAPATTAHLFFVKKDERGGVPGQGGMAPARDIVPFAGLYDKDGRPDPTGTMEKSIFKTFKVGNYGIKKGDVLRLMTPGGGGWGDPLERDIGMVEYDVRSEYVSVEAAEVYYGVIMNRETLKADEAATAQKRSELKEKKARGEWEMPPTRYLNWPT